MSHLKIISLSVMLLSLPSVAANGTWMAVNGPYNDYVTSILIGENGTPFVSTDSGGFASYDGCTTWTRLPIGGGDEFMAKKADGSLLASGNGTICHSDFPGVTWRVLVKPKILLSHMVSMTVAAGEVLIAAGKEIDTTWMGGSIGYVYKFYYSTDGALTWHDVAIQPQQGVLSPIVNYGLCTGGGYVFMKNFSGLYRAQNPAGACQKLSAPVPPDSIICFAAGASGALYLGARGRIFSSTTMGNDWGETVFSDTSLIVYSLCEVSTDTLILGTNDGIYRMVKRNPVLLQSKSLSTLIVFDVKSASSGVVYAGAGNGLFRSSDNGATWFQAGIVKRAGAQCLAVGKTDTLYAGTSRGVYRSGDFGSTWSLIMRGLPNSCYHHCTSSQTVINNIAVDPMGRVFIFAESGRYYRLDKASMQWQNVYTQTANNPSAIIFDSKAHIFLGTSDGIVFSRDSGDHFTNTGFSGQNIGFIAADRNDRLFISTESKTAPLQPALYRSFDTGVTWQRLNPPVDLQAAPGVGTVGPDNTIYVVTSNGTIITSKDLGTTWSKVHFADSTCQILSLRADESGVLYLGTYFHGLFISSDHGTTWSSFWTMTPKATGHAYETITDYRHNLFLATWPEGVLKYADYSPVIYNRTISDSDRINVAWYRTNSVIFDIRGRKVGYYNQSHSPLKRRMGSGAYLVQNGNSVRNVVSIVDR
jgi:photosystem II stability/assembly factor-like uncharacterized protein